jgi:hypothetical protein
MDKDTGGPAFPQYVISNGGAHVDGGMTLRDYFAAKAMQSILLHYDAATSFEEDEVNDSEGMPSLIAVDAYIMADAMLKARGQA